MKTTTQERIAFAVIAIGLLLSGYMDGQDHRLTQKYAQAQQGQKLACVDCAGGVR